MKSRRRRSKRLRVLHLWTLTEVEKAVPYLRSIVGSLREHWLDVLTTERKLERADKHPQARERSRRFAAEDMREDRQRAQGKFDDALHELNNIDVYLLDAGQGLALLPFRKEEELAWYVYDQFADTGLTGWRMHEDPFETCRPLNLLAAPAVPN